MAPLVCAYRLFARRKSFQEKNILNDVIVDEVRAIRVAHAALFTNGLHSIYEGLKKSEAVHLGKR